MKILRRDELREAVRAYRDAKGRHHTQKACKRLLSILPENANVDATGLRKSQHNERKTNDE